MTPCGCVSVLSGHHLPKGPVSQLLEPTSRTQEDARRLPVHLCGDDGGTTMRHHILSKRFPPQQVKKLTTFERQLLDLTAQVTDVLL